MGIFFFVVGLEIKRELLVGELAAPRRATLPVFAVVGGMIVPAVILHSARRGLPRRTRLGHTHGYGDMKSSQLGPSMSDRISQEPPQAVKRAELAPKWKGRGCRLIIARACYCLTRYSSSPACGTSKTPSFSRPAHSSGSMVPGSQ